MELSEASKNSIDTFLDSLTGVALIPTHVSPFVRPVVSASIIVRKLTVRAESLVNW